MTNQNISPLIGSKEVARILGVTGTTVRKWIHEHQLTPALRTPGGQYRFRRVEVIRFVEMLKRQTELRMRQEMDRKQQAIAVLKEQAQAEQSGRA